MLNRCFIIYEKKIFVVKFIMIIWILDNFKIDNSFFLKLFKYLKWLSYKSLNVVYYFKFWFKCICIEYGI